MNLSNLLKYAGLFFGLVAFLFIIGGVIAFFTGEFMQVVKFITFFYFATHAGIFGIFCLVASMVTRDKE